MRRPDFIIRSIRKRYTSAKRNYGHFDRLSPNAKEIGGGCERTAFRVFDYVIKATGYRPRRTFPKRIVKLGIQAPQQWFVNGWTIQPYYEKLNPVPEWLFNLCETGFRGYDFHEGNFRQDSRGRPVMIDW